MQFQKTNFCKLLNLILAWNVNESPNINISRPKGIATDKLLLVPQATFNGHLTLYATIVRGKTRQSQPICQPVLAYGPDPDTQHLTQFKTPDSKTTLSQLATQAGYDIQPLRDESLDELVDQTTHVMLKIIDQFLATNPVTCDPNRPTKPVDLKLRLTEKFGDSQWHIILDEPLSKFWSPNQLTAPYTATGTQLFNKCLYTDMNNTPAIDLDDDWVKTLSKPLRWLFEPPYRLCVSQYI